MLLLMMMMLMLLLLGPAASAAAAAAAAAGREAVVPDLGMRRPVPVPPMLGARRAKRTLHVASSRCWLRTALRQLPPTRRTATLPTKR
eukprot:COSAG01_NODE_1270_length_10961_cov_34.289423_2_plen_88_part_00